MERKGYGHPDTLADHLAEHLSKEYSKYTRIRYGAILHHNFDKLGLLGGASHVSFGNGYITKPIRVLINGRASTKFAKEIIPVEKLIVGWTKDFMSSRLPINTEKDLEFHLNLSHQSSPGKIASPAEEEGTRKFWFEPRSLDDLQELKKLLSNDTSIGVGYAPVSKLEKFIIELEHSLTMGDFKKDHLWIGSDVKLMALRNKEEINLTLCIPQICSFVRSVDEYKENLFTAKDYIKNFARDFTIDLEDVNINMRDNFDTSELYLTAIGSSIESGDEGLVGRGNRVNQLITPTKPMSIEGASGKNPVYHIGKLYYIAAHKLADRIFQATNLQNEVYLISQTGRDLKDPWIVAISIPTISNDQLKIETIIKNELQKVDSITEDLLEGNVLTA